MGGKHHISSIVTRLAEKNIAEHRLKNEKLWGHLHKPQDNKQTGKGE